MFRYLSILTVTALLTLAFQPIGHANDDKKQVQPKKAEQKKATEKQETKIDPRKAPGIVREVLTYVDMTLKEQQELVKRGQQYDKTVEAWKQKNDPIIQALKNELKRLENERRDVHAKARKKALEPVTDKQWKTLEINKHADRAARRYWLDKVAKQNLIRRAHRFKGDMKNLDDFINAEAKKLAPSAYHDAQFERNLMRQVYAGFNPGQKLTREQQRHADNIIKEKHEQFKQLELIRQQLLNNLRDDIKDGLKSMPKKKVEKKKPAPKKTDKKPAAKKDDKKK